MRSSRRQVLKYAVPAVVSAVAGPAVLAATGRVPQASADGMKLIGQDGQPAMAFGRWSNSLFVSHQSTGQDVSLQRGTLNP
jgi:hypothetical protein